MRWSKNFKVLKANSLVESVIAIAIISICILVAFLIYLNVIKQSKSVHYYEAKHKVEMLFNDTVNNNNYEDEDYVYKNYSIQKVVDISKKEHVIYVNYKIKTATKTYLINKVIALNNEITD